jgi:hypothetical protein
VPGGGLGSTVGLSEGVEVGSSGSTSVGVVTELADKRESGVVSGMPPR